MTVKWDSAVVDAKVRAAATRAVVAVTEAILEEGTRLIASPPKTGRIYHRRSPDRSHQASAPGEPPAADLGALIASGRAKYPEGGDPNLVRGIANWSSEHARFLELGTEKMEPRPFARPALETCAPLLQPGMKAQLKVEGL
jgi:HK97 gp10 family phage protein